MSSPILIVDGMSWDGPAAEHPTPLSKVIEERPSGTAEPIPDKEFAELYEWLNSGLVEMD